MNAQIPTLRCYVRLEFLHNLQSHNGEVEECDVVGVKSVPNRVLGFHVLLRNGAVFWDLPIHAVCTDPKAKRRPWWQCQRWDSPGEDVEVIAFERLKGMTAVVRPNSRSPQKCTYHCTLDWGPGPGLDLTFARLPEEAKCAHLLLGTDGNVFLMPNNRLAWRDKSFTVVPFPDRPTYRTQTFQWSSELAVQPLPDSDLSFTEDADDT